MATIKEEAQKLLSKLPDEATWDDLMYEIYVRKKIDAGVEAADAGKVISHDQVKRRFQSK
jgi:predicted transcriptional regulator